MAFNIFRRKKLSVEAFYEQKQSAIETLLKSSIETVFHAIIGYPLGGPLHIGVSKHPSGGTYLSSEEVMSFEDEYPKPNSLGRYELVMATKLERDGEGPPELEARLLYCRTVMTMIARYSENAILEPLQTVQLPMGENETHYYLFDAIVDEEKLVRVGAEAFHILCVIYLHESESDYARIHGTEAVVSKLKAAGHYPYSDLEREAVV